MRGCKIDLSCSSVYGCPKVVITFYFAVRFLYNDCGGVSGSESKGLFTFNNFGEAQCK